MFHASISNWFSQDRLPHSSCRIWRRVSCALGIAIAFHFVGCRPRHIVEFSLVDNPPVQTEQSVSVQTSVEQTSVGLAPPQLEPLEPTSSESPVDVDGSSESGPEDLSVANTNSEVPTTRDASITDISTAPFFVVPKQLSGSAIGKLLLQRGRSKNDVILSVAAVNILARSGLNLTPEQTVVWNKHLDEADTLSEEDELLRTLVKRVRLTVKGELPEESSPTTNGPWEVGIHRFTDVGLGELVAKYGQDRQDPLAHLAGLAMLARAERESGIPTSAELNQRVEKFLNGVTKPVWIALAARVSEMIDLRAIRERQRRPGQDWTEFLGPQNKGESHESDLVKKWPAEGPPVAWQFEAGRGFGTCSIQGGKLYLFDRAGEYNRLVCLDQETGEVLGETFAYAAQRTSPGGYRGPRCSPVIDGDRIYVLDESGRLHCVRAGTSHVLWKSDLTSRFRVALNRFGVAATPIIADDLLVVIVGGGEYQSSGNSETSDPKPNGSALVAFDKQTGEVVYASGNFLADYASPVTVEVEGFSWGLAFLREGLVGFAPNSGQILSHFPWRSKELASVNAATPVIVGNEVFVSNAFGQGSALLRIERSGFKPIWQDAPGDPEKRFEAYFSTPVVHDGFLYGCSGKDSHSSVLRCINWSTGEVMWSESDLKRISLILVDGQLICLSEYGELLLVEATPDEFRLISKVKLPRSSSERKPPEIKIPGLLEYPCWSAPVLSRGFLYLRSPNKLVCIDLLADNLHRHETTAIDETNSNIEIPATDSTSTPEVLDQPEEGPAVSHVVPDSVHQVDDRGEVGADLSENEFDEATTIRHSESIDATSILPADNSDSDFEPEPTNEPAQSNIVQTNESDGIVSVGVPDEVDVQHGDLNSTDDDELTPMELKDSKKGSSADGLLIPFRMWTNSKGKTANFAVVSAARDKVVFRKPNGDEHAYPISRLAKSDQKLIAEATKESEREGDN